MGIRRRYTMVIATVVMGSFFVSGSGAGPPAPLGPPDDFPAKALPIAPLSDIQRAAADELVGSVAAEFGISSESYSGVRRVAQTTVGALYLLPGTTGFCALILTDPAEMASTASCGSWADARQHSLSLFRHDPATGFLVGGGIVRQGVTQTILHLQDGSAVEALPVLGGFKVTSTQKIQPSDLVSIETR